MLKNRRAAVGLGLGMLLCPPGAALAQAAGRVPVFTTTQFSFFSDFDTNLNDELIAAGLAHKRSRPELFRSGSEAACFGQLPMPVRAAWNGAVAYYAEVISPADWSAREQFLIRLHLAGFDDEVTGEVDRQFVAIAGSFMAAAAPAYRACRWTDQDAKNRAWIDALKPRLAADERRIALRLAELYQTPWAGLPIPVDIVQTVNWSGANSIQIDPAGGHLMVSVENEGPAALEVVFHEASHLLMRPDAPVRKALDSAAGAAGWKMPDDLWHVVLFYTTGEAVRDILDDGEDKGYMPMLYAIFARGTWVAYRQPLESAWRPYIDGDRTLPEAAVALVNAIRNPEPAGGGN